MIEDVQLNKSLYILGIDTSCDDTGVGIVKKTISTEGETVTVVANQIWSQSLHAAYGGVMPELASREHVERISSVLDAALAEAGLTLQDIDGVAATAGPGLMGALLVGLMYGKALAQALKIPFYGIHHLEGHICAAGAPKKPHLALVVSGGHTHLFHVEEGRYTLVGATKDDAAGEAFDKVARLLGLGYPGGAALSKAAVHGDSSAVKFKEPLIGQRGFDFSFSGLKTAALLAHRAGAKPEDLAASFQRVAVLTLVKTTRRAAEHLGLDTVVVSGGVAANGALRQAFSETRLKVLFPPKGLNTDNGAMIALAAALYPRDVSDFAIGATPYWPLTEDRFSF